MSWSQRLLAGIAFCIGLALPQAPSQAEFRGAEHLAGWWLSVDEAAFPPMWRAGLILAMEELLVIDRQGGFQSRMMLLQQPDAVECQRSGPCSDAPILASGRLEATGGRLTFASVTRTPLLIEGADADPHVRARTLPASAQWLVEGEAAAGYGIMRLRTVAGLPPRVFVKVEPDVLRRVRAGFMVQQASPGRYWRCYLGRVAGDPAATGRLAPDPSLAAYLAAASLAVTLEQQAGRPVADDPDEARRALVPYRPESLLAEAFVAYPEPTTAAEQRHRAVRWLLLEQVRQGGNWQAATERVREATGLPDLDVPLDEAARQAWQQVSQDPGLYEQLFCHRP